jgi:hypothetical protein
MFAVGISDTRLPLDDADRQIWMMAEFFRGDVDIVTRDRLVVLFPGLPVTVEGDDPFVQQVAKDAVYDFIVQEEALMDEGAYLRGHNIERELQIRDLWIDDDVAWVTVLTDRVIDGRRAEITLGIDWPATSPAQAAADDCVYGERVDDDIRALVLNAVEEARREHTLSAIRRDAIRKEEKREIEREAKRIAQKAEDFGCTPSLARYVDSLERRIDHLFKVAVLQQP